MPEPSTFTVFADFRRHIHTGTDLAEAIDKARSAYRPGVQTVVVFNDATGDRTEIDPRADAELPDSWLEHLGTKPSGPGRPKLGVVSREISLLPRHWEWLNAQPTGASAAIRRLIDEARKQHVQRDLARTAKDAAYKFMSVVGGDRRNFEEASRALYADRFDDALELTASWPRDLKAHLQHLVHAAARCHSLAQQEHAAASGLASGDGEGP